MHLVNKEKEKSYTVHGANIFFLVQCSQSGIFHLLSYIYMYRYIPMCIYMHTQSRTALLLLQCCTVSQRAVNQCVVIIASIYFAIYLPRFPN